DLLFTAAWEDWLAEHLVKGDDVLLEALDAEIPLEGEGRFGERSSLRGFARALIDQRDLRPLVAETPADPRAWRRDLVANADRARAVLALAPHGDTLASRLQDLVAFVEQPETLDPAEATRRLLKMPAIPGNARGNRARWPREEVLEEARAIADWSRQALNTWKAAHGAALHGRIMAALAGVGDRYRRLKAERGVLDYLDLLLKARDALRDREPVRRHFRQRFRLLIIDEFQDTDPLQVEIARLLAGDAPGALVVVGDAKQSIYRFRRADVGLFRRLSEEAAARKSRAGDVMVLARRLTQLRHLEEALEAAGLRFAVEGGKSFFDRQEVHETLSVLRAVEDPTDRVSLVAALRSSFFGVSDRDI